MSRGQLEKKEYVGDGVYVAVDPYGALVLTTEDGYRATNTIVLEPEVLAALLRYVEQLRADVERLRAERG